jgi:phage minor structural protein
MIPVLFDKAATDFSSYGLGALTDAISCVVTEERNGSFELVMEYPMTGIHYTEIMQSNIILAKPSDNQNPQAFRIYRIEQPINGIVTVRAEHISYMLRFIPVEPFTAQNVSGAIAGVKSHSMTTNPFTFSTDKTNAAVFTLGTPKSAKTVLGGDSKSILELYGGEFKWDNFNVYLLNARGVDNDVTIRYGKNITDFEQEKDLSDTITGVLPYWKNQTDLIIGDITKVTSDLAYDAIETIDVSSDFDASTTPTKAEVTAAGATALSNHSYVNIPNINFKISFVDLAQTEEYNDIAPLEHVNLCDTVTIIFEQLGVSTKAKVIKTVYDCLLERYNEIEVGDKAYSLTTQVAQQTEATKDAVARIDVLDDQIVLKVSKGTVSSEISLESGQVTISGNRLVVNSTNFQLDASGNVTLKGSLTSGSTITGASISGGTIFGVQITGSTLIQTGQYGTVEISGGAVNAGQFISSSDAGTVSISSTYINVSSSSSTVTFGGSLSVSGNSVFLGELWALGNIKVGATTLTLKSQSVMIGESSYTTIHYLGY